MDFNYLFIFPPTYICPLRFQGSPETCQWECFLVFGNFSLFKDPSQDGSPSLPLLSLFLSFIFFLPPFKDNGLPFWVPDVLFQHSEVVLWNFLSVQMFFWWICGEKMASLSYSSTILGPHPRSCSLEAKPEVEIFVQVSHWECPLRRKLQKNREAGYSQKRSWADLSSTKV